MKTIKEIESDHELVLNELSVRIVNEIKRIGGLKHAVNKSKLTAMMLNYSISTDNFKTKIRTLKTLEVIK